jgi:hypothetical protein
VALYGQVHEALCRIDREGYKASDLAQLDRALDPPGNIPPAKAIAVLKAIMGSTPEDKLSLETFHGARFDADLSVGSFVGRQVQELGLGYHDFWPFLRASGWVTKSPERDRGSDPEARAR